MLNERVHIQARRAVDEELDMQKHDAKKQDDKNENPTLPPDGGKSALERLWRSQLNRIKERAELETGRSAEGVDRLEQD